MTDTWTRAEKAKKAARRLFPGADWEELDERIYVAKSKLKRAEKAQKKRDAKLAKGEEAGEDDWTNFLNERENAEILRDLGHTVYLVPETTRGKGSIPQFDALVDGKKMEFKNMTSDNFDTFAGHFLKSRTQAPNVFFNLEKAEISSSMVRNYLSRARFSDKYPVWHKEDKENKTFKGGEAIFKIKGHNGLIRIRVNKIKQPGSTEPGST
ncbi:MAG: hypothetical protein LBM77_00890 [Spirochaetaceae bacterium]|jgi:hypothetical protein|nr:hypothetical protein [Spirochaetaceae bacterium]